MRVVEILRRPTSDERSHAVAFVRRIAERLGRPPLSDHPWLALSVGDDAATTLVRIADPTGTIALAVTTPANDATVLEVVVDREATDAERVHDDAAATAIDAHGRARRGPLTWWLDDPTPAQLALAHEHGLEPTRRLQEMRVPLPLDTRASITTRAFRPGADEQAWLAVNNRAFAAHGEQGGWTLATLRQRMAEDWFDPDGFRLHETEGRLDGFCWTKIHTDEQPPVGEIYVIAVDPDAGGRGLGTQLTLAGLDSITERGLGMANLYVDAGNAPATAMYERLGFRVHRTRHALAGTVVT